MIYPDRFIEAFKFMFYHEGGTNPDPIDRGGLTKYGISQKQYPSLDIEKLTVDDAQFIYYNDYWIYTSCHRLEKAIDVVVFDSAVNCGQHSVGIWLQRTCNLMGTRLKEDGIIGSKTINAINSLPISLICQGVITFRLARYENLIKNHPEQIKYIRGWIKRANELSFYSIKEVWANLEA